MFSSAKQDESIGNEKGEENRDRSAVRSSNWYWLDYTDKNVGEPRFPEGSDFPNTVPSSMAKSEFSDMDMVVWESGNKCADNNVDKTETELSEEPGILMSTPQCVVQTLAPVAISGTSSALTLMENEGRYLQPYEVVAIAVRNSYHGNLELRFKKDSLHVDRFMFSFYAKNYADCKSPIVELPLPLKSLKRLYSWMVERKPELCIRNQLVPLYQAAKFLGMHELIKQYWHTLSLSDTLGLWEENAFRAFVTAREHSCDDLMAMLLTRMRKTFLPLVASEEFVNMNINEVLVLLKQESLSVNSEDEVFFAAVRWLDHDWSARKIFAELVITSLALQLLSPWLLRSLTNVTETETILELSQLPKVQNALFEAAKHCIGALIMRSMAKVSQVEPLRRTLAAPSCVRRSWIYCLGVPHHHDVKCPRFRELTYHSFKLFLTQLQKHSHIFLDTMQSVPNKYWSSYECCAKGQKHGQSERKCPRPIFYELELECGQPRDAAVNAILPKKKNVQAVTL